jgi:hypothetical protein
MCPTRAQVSLVARLHAPSADGPLGLYCGAWKQFGDYVRLRALAGVYFYLLTHPEAVERKPADWQFHSNHRRGPLTRLAASAGKG